MWKKLWKGYKLPKQTDNSQYNEKNALFAMLF